MRRVFIFINGILTRPGAHDGWTDRAVTWTQTRTPHKAEKWEYATGPLLRRFRQQARARKIATLMAYYERTGFEIVLVGHSNGCDIIARVLELRGAEDWLYHREVRAVHLFAPAADGDDFRGAISFGDVERVHVHCGGRDQALRAGRWTRRLFGWAGLGYGSLGIEPDQLHAEPQAYVHEYPDYGHSDFFAQGEAFERTMQKLFHLDDAFGDTTGHGAPFDEKLPDPSDHENT